MSTISCKQCRHARPTGCGLGLLMPADLLVREVRQAASFCLEMEAPEDDATGPIRGRRRLGPPALHQSLTGSCPI